MPFSDLIDLLLKQKKEIDKLDTRILLRLIKAFYLSQRKSNAPSITVMRILLE